MLAKKSLFRRQSLETLSAYLLVSLWYKDEDFPILIKFVVSIHACLFYALRGKLAGKLLCNFVGVHCIYISNAKQRR